MGDLLFSAMSGGSRPARALLIVVVVVLATLAVPSAGATQPATVVSALSAHAPIDIEGNAGFIAANGVVSGSGTLTDPYVISGWSISSTSAQGIQIRNTDAHVVLRDLQVTAASVAALYLYQVSNVTLANVTAQVNNGDGMRFESSRSITVDGSQLVGNAIGLVMLNSADAVVRNTNFTANAGDGVVLTASPNVTLEANHFAYNGFGSGAHGIELAFTTDDVVLANRFVANGIFLDGDALNYFDSHTITADNLIGGLPVLYEKDCNGLGLTGMDLGQLLLAGCRHARLSNLTAGGGDVGILIAFGSDAIVGPGVTVSNASLGLEVTQSTGIQIRNATIVDTATGIQVDASTDVRISGTKISAPFAATGPYDGLSIRGSDLVNASQNVIRHHRSAIAVTGSGNVTLSENVAGLNVLGLAASTSNDLVVTQNRFTQDTHGMRLQNLTNGTFTRNAFLAILAQVANVSGSSGLRFVRNVFASPQDNAYDAQGAKDSWDGGYPAGGNFWGDYAGTDQLHGPGQNLSGPDGFGDTPYTFAVNAADHYPLMVSPVTADLPPDALLLVAPAVGTVLTPFHVTANLSSDFEDPLAALLVRWSWDGGVTWTQWVVGKSASHRFDTIGVQMIVLQVRDTAGLTDTWFAVVRVDPKPDVLPPAILFSPPATAEMGHPIPIVVNITDASGIANATLLYRDVDGGPFRALALQPVANETNFTTTIPAQGRVGTVEVVIYANDSWANEARAPVGAANTIQILDTTTPLYFGLTVAAGLVTAVAMMALILWRRRQRIASESQPPTEPARPPGNP